MPIADLARKASQRMLASVVSASLSLWSAHSHADDISAGKEKAQSCIVCHGVNGIAQMPNAPHLAGQPAAYLSEQLKNFRSGKRSHEVMTVIAKPLSDQDIASLAAWYASLKIEVKAQ